MPEPAAIAERIRAWDSSGPQGPITLELYPTLRCNLSCAFCDTTERHRPAVRELSAQRQLALLEEAAALGVRQLFVLGGGEPLMARELLPRLLARAKALGMEGILNTNGTLLGPDLADQLVATGWDEVHFSIDGPVAEVHDALRGVPGAFRRSVTAICRLGARRAAAAAELPRIALHFVLTRHNLHTLEDMLHLAHTLGAFRVDFDALVAYRPEQLALDLPPDQKSQVPRLAARALALATELGIATTLEHFLEPQNLERGQRTLPAANPSGEPENLLAGLRQAPCLKAWHCLVVQADGHTSPCCVLAGQGESVAQRSLQEVWHEGESLQSMRRAMLRGAPPARCRECSANILGHERLIRSLV